MRFQSLSLSPPSTMCCRYGDVLTDADGLPLVYDSDSIGRYWDKRPGEVGGRMVRQGWRTRRRPSACWICRPPLFVGHVFPAAGATAVAAASAGCVLKLPYQTNKNTLVPRRLQ